MSEYCLECFKKQNPDYPLNKICVAESGGLELCEGCGQMKPVVSLKTGIFRRLKNKLEAAAFNWRLKNNQSVKK